MGTRGQALIEFNWEHDLVLHEAGVPPLHTPVSTFVDLPARVLDNLYLVHVADKDVPTDQGLRAAKEGVDHTVRDVCPLVVVMSDRIRRGRDTHTHTHSIPRTSVEYSMNRVVPGLIWSITASPT